jgi:hypothetical protein
MKRSAAQVPTTPKHSLLQPTEANARLALREAANVLAPAALWAIRSGVGYPAFAEMLKAVFVEAAQKELAGQETEPTQSALSLLSGVHRKDVRTLMAGTPVKRNPPRPSLAAQVYTRWLSDPAYRGRDGRPKRLVQVGSKASFESLCHGISSDVHSRTVLDELLRLGHVALEGDRVVPLVLSFVPMPRLEEMTALMASHVADHLAAAVSNLGTSAPPFLEQAIHADGLSVNSVEVLHDGARAAWARVFGKMVRLAQERVEADRKGDGVERVRFGVYFFSEPTVEPAPPAGPRAATRRTRRSASGSAT